MHPNARLGDRATTEAVQQRAASVYTSGVQTSPFKIQSANLDEDMQRICGLPVSQALPDEFRQELNDLWVLDNAKRRDFKLWDEQIDAAYTYWIMGGAFCPIGCGFGKTLLSFLCAHIAYTSRGLGKGLLMVPPKLAKKTNKDLIEARHLISISTPFIKLAGETKRRRGNLARSGRRGCYVFPYSFLQVSDAVDMLDAIDPDYMILDEAHAIKNTDAASTRRLLAYLHRREESGRPVELVAMSGTMTSKRLADYHHTISYALRDNAPVPLKVSRIEAWDEVLDVNATHGGSVGPLAQLVQWARGTFPEEQVPESRSGFRKAYALRLNSAPGVVSTGDREVGATLLVEPFQVPLPKEGEDASFDYMQALIHVVRDAWITPNGDEISHAFHLFKWEYELCSGFYNKLRWPTTDEVARKYRIQTAEADQRINASIEHHALQNSWHKLMRTWIDMNPTPGLDTPMTIGAHIATNGSLPRDEFGVAAAWHEMHEADFDGRPDRISEPVRVCDFKVQAIADWVEKLPKGEGCIVWCWNSAFREWIVEILEERGVRNVINGKAGDNAVEELILTPKKARGCKFILSMGSFKQGHNMQYLENMMFGQVPRQALVAEQAVARIHREGFEGDELTAYFARGLEHDTLTFQACCNDALYIHESLGNNQRLISADYPQPLGFVPLDVLRTRVPQLESLSPEMAGKFQQLFGGQ